MKIGFFGDSYCDLYYKFAETPRHWKPWSRRLIEDYGYDCVSSGASGSNQFYAINQWLTIVEKNIQVDYAFFTFTWHNRLYSKYDVNHQIFSAIAEKRDVNPIIQEINTWKGVPENLANNVQLATSFYYDHIYSDEQARFNFELQIEYILSLPDKFPKTNFIFIPNTEYSRRIALEKFSKGCLINFAFETLSNIETGSPGIMPFDCGRICHLNDTNHELITQEFHKIIKDYNEYKNKVYPFDYTKFDIQQ